MRALSAFAFVLLAGLAGILGGYRLGSGSWPDADALLSLPGGKAAEKRVSTVPEDGSAGRKILYYRNPMGLPDTSPVPKKDWMGMDYIAVYEGDEEAEGSTVEVSLQRVQLAGVRSEPAKMSVLAHPVRAAGTIALDESSLNIVTLRFDGYIEHLYAATTGQRVTKGEPLFRVFSPEVLSALANYRTSMGGSRSGRDGAMQRLDNLAVPRDHVRLAAESGGFPGSIDWPSPVSGTIMEKMVIEGERAEAGRALFRIADLSRVWVMAEVPEQDLASIRIGDRARIALRALPGTVLEGKVAFVYPELGSATRTGRVRIVLANPDGLLKPEMFADVTIDAGTGEEPRLVVPVEAIIDSGKRQIVLLDKGEGRFEPHEVRLGRRGDSEVEILEGIAAGDRVVVNGNFLIDAESNLKAALQSLAPPPPAAQRASAAGGAAAAEVTP